MSKTISTRLCVNSNSIFGFHFYCPVDHDRRKVFVKRGQTVAYFGAAGACFGGPSAIEAKIDWKQMKVIATLA